MNNTNWQARIIAHKQMLSALESGTATPEQQQAAFTHIKALKAQHNEDMRDAQRDSRDSYHAGRSDAAAEDRGEPYGTY